MVLSADAEVEHAMGLLASGLAGLQPGQQVTVDVTRAGGGTTIVRGRSRPAACQVRDRHPPHGNLVALPTQTFVLGDGLDVGVSACTATVWHPAGRPRRPVRARAVRPSRSVSWICPNACACTELGPGWVMRALRYCASRLPVRMERP